MDNLTPYYIEWSDWYSYYVPLIPTGRWKIVSDAYHDKELFVEHKRPWYLSNLWIASDQIEMRPASEEFINECS